MPLIPFALILRKEIEPRAPFWAIKSIVIMAPDQSSACAVALQKKMDLSIYTMFDLRGQNGQAAYIVSQEPVSWPRGNAPHQGPPTASDGSTRDDNKYEDLSGISPGNDSMPDGVPIDIPVNM